MRALLNWGALFLYSKKLKKYRRYQFLIHRFDKIKNYRRESLPMRELM